MTHWVFLALAIVTEVIGTLSMKLSNGFEHPVYGVMVFLFYGASFYLLTLALKHIDLSIAYAIWAGLGVALISMLGFVVFDEPLGTVKVLSLVAIIAGVVGLNISA